MNVFIDNYYSTICAILPSTTQFAYKKGTFSGLNSGEEVPKTILDCGGQGCRIISDKCRKLLSYLAYMDIFRRTFKVTAT
jgi:hypothetical protein